MFFILLFRKHSFSPRKFWVRHTVRTRTYVRTILFFRWFREFYMSIYAVQGMGMGWDRNRYIHRVCRVVMPWSVLYMNWYIDDLQNESLFSTLMFVRFSFTTHAQNFISFCLETASRNINNQTIEQLKKEDESSIYSEKYMNFCVLFHSKFPQLCKYDRMNERTNDKK